MFRHKKKNVKKTIELMNGRKPINRERKVKNKTAPQWRDIYILREDFMQLRAGEPYIIRDIYDERVIISRSDLCLYECARYSFSLPTFLKYFEKCN